MVALRGNCKPVPPPRRARVVTAIRGHLAENDSALIDEISEFEIEFDGVIDVWKLAGAVLAAIEKGES